MKLAIAVLALFAFVSTAHAGDPLKPYVGRIVISPDKPPMFAEELPTYLAASAVKDDDYPIAKGSPWDLWLVAVLPKETTKQHVLHIVNKADPKNPLLVIDVPVTKRYVIINAEATVEAGFAANKSYAVRLLLGKKVVAKSTLTLRD
jgi:hypothetical protein